MSTSLPVDQADILLCRLSSCFACFVSTPRTWDLRGSRRRSPSPPSACATANTSLSPVFLIAAGCPPHSLTSSGSVLGLVFVQPGLTASVSHTPLAVYVKSNGIVDDLCDRPPVFYPDRISRTFLQGQ